MLRCSVPIFRLPEIVLAAEWANLTALGAELLGGKTVGKDRDLEELGSSHDAVIADWLP